FFCRRKYIPILMQAKCFCSFKRVHFYFTFSHFLQFSFPFISQQSSLAVKTVSHPIRAMPLN
ncbi:MAG: hypothetical protein AAF806_31420, partial [Bacteroidota bacterium]